MASNNVELFPVIDMQTLGELRSIMQDEFYDVLYVYLEESLSLMNDIYIGFESANELLPAALDALKSSSSSLGAKKLSAIIHKMELLVNQDKVDCAKSLLDELQDAFTQSHNAIREQAKNASSEANAY